MSRGSVWLAVWSRSRCINVEKLGTLFGSDRRESIGSMLSAGVLLLLVLRGAGGATAPEATVVEARDIGELVCLGRYRDTACEYPVLTAVYHDPDATVVLHWARSVGTIGGWFILLPSRNALHHVHKPLLPPP